MSKTIMTVDRIREMVRKQDYRGLKSYLVSRTEGLSHADDQVGLTLSFIVRQGFDPDGAPDSEQTLIGSSLVHLMRKLPVDPRDLAWLGSRFTNLSVRRLFSRALLSRIRQKKMTETPELSAFLADFVIEQVMDG